MKEHRTKALRVTTPHSIESSNASNKDEFISRENANDLFGTLQILQFEILPSSERSEYNGSAATSSSETSCSQSTSSTQYTQSETMTMHTATITANSVFGKHDSFYRWFSQNDEGRRIDEGSHGAEDLSCSGCNDNQDEQASSETCHCRSSTFHNRKFRHKKSVSPDGIHLPLPLLHSEYSDSLLNIVSGNLCENWFLKIRDIKEVIRRAKVASQRDDWCRLKDKNGNTVLLVSGQKLLGEKQFEKAVELVKILLEEGADVNVINHENRTLLSYSISCMDESIQLTTLLLNYGANIWSMDPIQKLPSLQKIKKMNSNYSGRRNCNNSAFAWFLRGVMSQLQLSDQCLRTFYVLAETMGENPTEMQRHVIATMLNHSKCYTIFGPVFYQIKQAMHPYWSQPRSLKYLCRSVIRNSIINVPGRYINDENVSSLMLPPSLQSYLMLES